MFIIRNLDTSDIAKKSFRRNRYNGISLYKFKEVSAYLIRSNKTSKSIIDRGMKDKEIFIFLYPYVFSYRDSVKHLCVYLQKEG